MDGIKGDLHCHTHHSDGSASVEQLVTYAKRLGLRALAITDHDTMVGVETFMYYANLAGIIPVPGVECSSRDYQRNRPVHMLCYFPQNYPVLKKVLDQTLLARMETKHAMAELIMKEYPISWDDICFFAKDSSSVYESHLMMALAMMGYTSTVIGPLMDQLIGKNGKYHIPVPYPDTWEIAKTIKEAGGLAVVAHPGQFDSLELAEELAQAGLLDGIECYHPRNSATVTAQALTLARKYGLIVTGGSDFHGQFAKSPHPIGTCTTDEENLHRLLETARYP